MSALVFNCSPYQNRVALVENARTVELLVKTSRLIVGGKYLQGQSHSNTTGYAGAFVDIGLERAAFLYVGDIATQKSQ